VLYAGSLVALIARSLFARSNNSDSRLPLRVVPDDGRAALKAAGKQSRLVALKAEDHWLSRSEMRTQVLIELERFLAESLK
jgi:hypothetical protein